MQLKTKYKLMSQTFFFFCKVFYNLSLLFSKNPMSQFFKKVTYFLHSLVAPIQRGCIFLRASEAWHYCRDFYDLKITLAPQSWNSVSERLSPYSIGHATRGVQSFLFLSIQEKELRKHRGLCITSKSKCQQL